MILYNNCKLCGEALTNEPVFKFENMPKSAQHLPSIDDITTEEGIELNVFECCRCGLVQLNCPPVYYYKDVIRATSVSNVIREHYLQRLVPFVNKYGLHNKKVLEVGCGEGSYLSFINEAGMNGFGIENSEELVNECRTKNLKVEKGFFEGKFVSENAPFSAFFTFNFLEHFPNPKESLINICDNLSDDAVGMVEVPNFDMMLKNKLFMEFIPDHLCYYTQKTLSNLLEISGFEVIKCDVLRSGYVLSAIVKKKKKINWENCNDYLKELMKEVDAFVGESHNLAVWGAGHQSLTILSMLKNINKVKYIIDSAKFKQGRYSPASHIQIVSPDILDKGAIDSILIIGGSYSEEIADIVSKKYPNINLDIQYEWGIEKR